MKISYQFTIDEYDAILAAKKRRGMRFGAARDALGWVAAIGFIGFAIFSLTTGFAIGQSGALPYVLLGCGAVMIASRTLLGPWSRKRYFRQQMLEDRKIETEFSSDGIVTHSDNSETKFKWQAVQRVDDEPGHIIFWTSKVMAISVPKAAMTDAQKTEIRALVSANVEDQELVN